MDGQLEKMEGGLFHLRNSADKGLIFRFPKRSPFSPNRNEMHSSLFLNRVQNIPMHCTEKNPDVLTLEFHLVSIYLFIASTSNGHIARIPILHKG